MKKIVDKAKAKNIDSKDKIIKRLKEDLAEATKLMAAQSDIIVAREAEIANIYKSYYFRYISNTNQLNPQEPQYSVDPPTHKVYWKVGV